MRRFYNVFMPTVNDVVPQDSLLLRLAAMECSQIFLALAAKAKLAFVTMIQEDSLYFR
jgi:hypothetical protein